MYHPVRICALGKKKEEIEKVIGISKNPTQKKREEKSWICNKYIVNMYWLRVRCQKRARMKSELLYDRYNMKKMTTDEHRTIIWRHLATGTTRGSASPMEGFLR